MAVIRDQALADKLFHEFTEQLTQYEARFALSRRFNPNHGAHDRTMRTELERLAGARTIAAHAAGIIVDIPDAREWPKISAEDRARRDAYREYLPNGRLYRGD